MNLLALDTSSLACSVAARVDGETTVRCEEKAKQHTRLLLPMIREVVGETGTQMRDFDAIVLGNGPGSFIGMRIAASVAQGLAHGAGIRIIPVSSMAAVAAQVLDQSDAATVAVAQDAHMNEVYFGQFRRGAEKAVVELAPERLQAATRIDDLGQDTRPAGYGWLRYPQLAAANKDRLSGGVTVQYPNAKYLLTLADVRTAIQPAQVEPAYLRQKVAEKPAESGD